MTQGKQVEDANRLKGTGEFLVFVDEEWEGSKELYDRLRVQAE